MKIKLGQLFKLSSGKSLPEKKRVAGDINVYGGNGITGKHNNYFVEQSTVVIGRVGEYCGAAHLTTDFCWVTDNALMVTEWYMEVNKEYIVYLLNALDLHRFAKTVGQPSISQGTVYDLEVELPELIVQEEVVKKLNKVKTIVDSRNIQIKYFDELIKARFVEMFGDVSTGNYKYRTRKLGEVSKVGSSHRVFTTEFVEEGIPFYRGTEIGELANGVKPTETFYISEEHYRKLVSDDTKPQIGDLLIPSICNKGQVWMVDTTEPFYYKDGRVLCISPDREIFDTKYLEYYMKTKTLVEYPKLGSGSTFAEFKIFLLKDMDALIPPRELQEQFAIFAKQIDKSKFEVQKSLDEIQTLMDSLMQKYFG